jgi:hypothetical protein
MSLSNYLYHIISLFASSDLLLNSVQIYQLLVAVIDACYVRMYENIGDRLVQVKLRAWAQQQLNM